MFAVYYPVTDSTTDRARRLARLNPGRPLRVAARIQTQGKGRGGSAWHSPPGGAWFSLAWPVHGPPAPYEPAPLVAGLVAAEAIEHLCPSLAGHGKLKWPNDLLWNNGKVAGILCHLEPARQQEPGALIIGIGINATVPADDLPRAWPKPVSLSELTNAPRPAELIEAITSHLESALTQLETAGFDRETQARINARLAWRDDWVSVENAGAATRGRLVEIDSAGRAVLATDGGTQSFQAGQIRPLCQPDPVG